MQVASHGASSYRILLSEQASLSEEYAASQLQEYLEAICGARLPIENASSGNRTNSPTPGKAIVVGETSFFQELGIDLARYALGPDGFLIKTIGDTLVIAGGRQRGTLY